MPKSKTEPIDPVSALGFKPDFDTIILQGDCSNWLKEMPAESVNCAVSSPPYFGLRDYGTATWEGGSSECDHVETIQNLNRGFNECWGNSPGDRKQENCRVSQYRGTCTKCGAVRRDHQIGLEATIEDYVHNLMAVFAEVKRVLRDDGTFWLNLGDSYAAQGGPQVDGTKQVKGSQLGAWRGESRRPPQGVRPKSLIGMPWRVALALQADGWILRSDIIWSKPNCMPSSVRDRPTTSHEYMFLLTKSSRYRYDATAIAEPAVKGAAGSTFHTGKTGINGLGRVSEKPRAEHPTRNKRSVWSVSTRSFPGAHFATFPQALVEPCILAGCPEGGVVLDPFAGSGTVGVTARSLNRRSVLIELNPEYVEMIENRLEERFTTVTHSGVPVNGQG